MSHLLLGAGQNSASAGGSVDIGDNVANSLMLDSASSQYLSRVVGTPTNNKIGTVSVWLKRGGLSAIAKAMLLGTSDDTSRCYLSASATDDRFLFNTDTVANTTLTSNREFRDPLAFFHLLIAVDTTQATAANRVRVYVEGTEQSNSASEAINSLWNFNVSGKTAYIGRQGGQSRYWDGYMADFIFVDGQQLTPSSFGRTSTDTGQWVHKTYAGTYGNNGFRLDFANSADLGNDVSGNNNDWTTNGGISSSNQYTDTPTNNFCVWNALVPSASLTIGNTKVAASTLGRGTIGVPSTMKAYWEVTSTGGTTTAGMLDGTNTATSTTTITTGVTKGFRFDAGAGTFDWTTDGSAWTSIATGLTTHQYVPYVSTAAATTATINAGQRTLAYTVPSGYSSLNTANLPTPTIPKPSAQFDAKIRTGTGASYSVSGIGFSPDLVWVKGRSGATGHAIYDIVRGVQLQLESNTTTAESTETTGLTAFNSDGYTAGALAQMNTNAATYIDWMWNAGTSTVSNTSGSITSSVRANTDAGISVLTFTGTGANATVGHGLSSALKFLMIRRRNAAGYDNIIWHSAFAGTDVAYLNSTSAKVTSATMLNSTVPTSSVFSVGTNINTNESGGLYLAYCFAEIEGFSKFGSYTANASANGPFVHCGFKPRWILVKRTDSTESWAIIDTARDTYNVSSLYVYPNTAAAEGTTTLLDVISNAFKWRNTAGLGNVSTGTYIYAAFAESPFKYATAR